MGFIIKPFPQQRAFASLVRLFDQYGLSQIFAPGFPGLLESFYVHERVVEFLMPEVHQAFVSPFRIRRGARVASTDSYASDHPLHLKLFVRHQVVHHTLCQFGPVQHPTPPLGWVFLRGRRLYRAHGGCCDLELPRYRTLEPYMLRS